MSISSRIGWITEGCGGEDYGGGRKFKARVITRGIDWVWSTVLLLHFVGDEWFFVEKRCETAPVWQAMAARQYSDGVHVTAAGC